MFNYFLVGEFIHLIKASEIDAEDIYLWRSSKSGELLHQPKGYSVDMQKKWINSRPKTEINYIIHDKNTDQKVGMIGIYDVNAMDLVTDCGRLILDYECIKNGSPYGLESLLLCYDHIFNVMKFRKITGTINARNEKVVSLQSYLGMQQEGRLKKHTLTNGKYEDLLIFSLFAEDFNKYKDKINKLLDKYR